MPQQQTFTDVQPITQTFSDVQPISDSASASTVEPIAKTISKTSGISAQPKPFTKEWIRQNLWRAGAATADVAPAAGATAGAMIGSMEGPVAAVGGAGVGGMGGEAAKQLLRRKLGFTDVPKTSVEAARDIAKQGTIQGGVQALSEVVPGAAGPIERAAETQYERALAPTTKINKAITKKIVPELLQRGERGSLESLEERATTQAAKVKPKLDVAYGQTPASATTGSGTTILQDLDKLKGKYVVQGKVANPTAVNAIDGVKDVVQQYGADIDPTSLRQLKSIFDEPVAARGGYAGGDLTTAYTLKAQKVAGNSIRKIMHQASPDVAALDKEITFWLNVQRVTSQSGLRQTGQAGGLVKVLSPLAGIPVAGAGVATGHTGAGIEAAVGTSLAALAVQVVRSPWWRTTSAVFKNDFADALASGSVGKVLALTARFGGVAIQDRQTNPEANLQTQ